MKVVYVGPSPAVEVNTPGGYVGVVRGEPVEFPAAVAKSLLEQDIWHTVDKAVPAAMKSQED